MQPKNTGNRSAVDINSPFYLYRRDIQSIPVLSKDDEKGLYQAIESHLKEILWILTKVPESLDIIQFHFEQITRGVLKLDTLVHGFASLDPLQSKPTSSEIEQRLFKLLTHQYNTQGKLKALGPASYETKASQLQLMECLTEFKWTSQIIDQLVHYAQTLTIETDLKHRLLQALTALKRAKQFLSASNLRLVFFIAKKYTHLGTQFLDLIQEGNIGLIQAIDRFDYRWGYAFSSYASIWIKHAILNALSKLQSAPAENDEILETIEDEKTPLPIEVASAEDLRKATQRVLSSLPPHEANVLRLRFGIGVPCSHTLNEIGEIFNLSRERIRQIEAKALKALRDQVEGPCLKSFLNNF